MNLATEQVTLTARWLAEGRRFAVAALIDADGSSPFQPGAFLLLDEHGVIEGSITGGCVEADVVREGLELLQGKDPARLLRYGVSDDLAQSVGLMCGGNVRVLLHEPRERDRATLATAFDAIARGQPVAIGTLLEGERAGARLALVGGRLVGGLDGGELLDRQVSADLHGALTRGDVRIRRYGPAGEALGDAIAVQVQSFLPPPRMVIVGASDYSAALAPLASTLGFDVTIVDARPGFIASERFSRAAEVVRGWPQEVLAGYELGPRDALLVLSHDPRFDEPALLEASRTPVGYIGALGSRRTAADRRRRLAALGLDAEQLARIHAPCGLDLGGASPEEVAVSILAEIIASRNARGGGPLAAAGGPIRDR